MPKKKSTILALRPGGLYCEFTLAVIFILVLIPILFLLMNFVNANEKASGRKIPFQPGEKLTYKGTWGIRMGIPWVIIIVDNVVTYRDPPGGRPLIHTEQVDIKPLGPLQDIGTALLSEVPKMIIQ